MTTVDGHDRAADDRAAEEGTAGGRATGEGTADGGARTVTPARAAQELELKRDEFRLAVQLGLVRTVPVGEGGRRRVERRELDRLRAAPDFPAGLRDRVRAVGTGEAAALLGITADRFTRLARTGHLSPVRFSLNRYRAVVWTYLAEEVADFGRTCPALLTGRLPLELRERLAAREDLRPRNWRARRLALLLRAADDPWARASAIASLLDPLQVAEVVDDPYERAHLDRLRPPPPPGMPVPAAAREIADRLARADDPDEILWHRLSLALALDEARAASPAPYPGEAPHPGEATGTAPVAPSVWAVPGARKTGVEPSAWPEAVPFVRPVPADPWSVPVTVSGGPRALSARPVPTARPFPGTPLLPEVAPFSEAPPHSGVPPFSEVPPLSETWFPSEAQPLPEGRPHGEVPPLQEGQSLREMPPPSEGPPLQGMPPRPAASPVAPSRRVSRPARARFLDRFRRGGTGGEARARRRRRPVAWP
ncbi:DUF6397 family protein [Streptomyces bikiniensis]|uniref:DUF6397 family protein n=1 Tax=Streptomyces bikiniensis TaxID=1896 RepID=UPI000998176D|nr:DUF6397 family protein [Streptomyces bikiniensis]